jgi:hypothetical protein
VGRIRAGERKYLSFTYGKEAPSVVPPLGEAARGRLERTARWWQEWANRCGYRGPYQEAVIRSALALTRLPVPSSRRPPPRSLDGPAAFATGTTATAGCATHHSRCVHSPPSATTRRRKPSTAGCSTPRASLGPSYRCSTMCSGKRGCPSENCHT